MTIPSIIYANYEPSQIRVDNLGIALFNDTSLDLLNLTPTQHLIVGEKQDGKYSFIVDATGIAVNTSLPMRTDNQSQYAAYIDGDVYVTGNVLANGGVLLGAGSGGGGGGEYISPWLPSDTDNNIWFPGTVTMGDFYDSSNNGYTVNIVQSADRTIDHAQLSIQNTEYAQIRMGIVGTSIQSPSIINTPSTTPLEFHIGRDQDYFTKLYTQSNYVTTIVEQGNIVSEITEMRLTPDEIPHYEYYDKSVAPHILIDTQGNIGIHTSKNTNINYNVRIRDPVKQENIIYSPVTEPMTVHINGSTYTSNLLLYDYETNSIKNADELYIRRLSATIPANQINPGTFANGDYSFTSNVNIRDGDLYVNGSGHLTQNILVDGTSTLNQIIANDAILVDVASFCNDVYINRDIIINHSLRIRGQIFTEMLSNIDYVDGVPRSNYAWQMIDFMPSSPLLSNINFTGNGFWTPGRVGIGTNNGFNNQLSIFKYGNNIYELELHNSDPTLTYSAGAFIGHPAVADEMSPDGSLVIATPALKDPQYFGLHPLGVPQNIYFFPGADMGTVEVPLVRLSNPPTLGIFYNNTVGIGTYTPLSTLDVRGTITFSGELHYYDQTVNPPLITNIGLWKSKTFQSINPYTNTPITFKGIQFSSSDSSNVAINVNPEPIYALTVGGGSRGSIKSYNGYFTGDNRKIVPWLDSQDPLTLINNVAPVNKFGLFTYGAVGIGVAVPDSDANLVVKGNYKDGTLIRLYQGDNSAKPTSGIEFVGNQTWRILADSTTQTLQFGNCNSFLSDFTSRALWMRGNQVVIGDNIKALDYGNINTLDPTAALTVGGNMAVKGDVNITGSFRINSVPYQNSVIVGQSTSTPLQNDDVFIGGGHIILTPADGKTVVIGKPGSSGQYLNSAADRSLFRVYQDESSTNPSPIVGIFHTLTKTGLLSIVDNNGHALNFGLIDPSDPTFGNGINTVFSFMDENNSSYISFNKTATAERYTGINTNLPTSMLHIYSEGTGSNMLKLTKFVYGQDSSSACPELYFEKTYQQTVFSKKSPTRWTIKGPNAGSGQKLGFIYEDDTTPATELFCFTNTGCIGIGTTQPEFALDVCNTGKTGSLRLLNTDNRASPQLLFQSGSSIYGSDPSYDFRMTASNSEFTFDMQNNITADITILNVNNQGNIGLKAPADPKYELLVTGALNVTDGIYLNGARLFSSGGSSSLDQGLPLTAINLFLQPYTAYGGGVVVNGSQPTSNLFHIYNGVNANFMVFESLDYTSASAGEIQLHFRNVIRTYDFLSSSFTYTNNMYRMSMSNTQFLWEYNPNCGNQTYIGSEHTNYKKVIQFGPSVRTGATNEFDTIFNGAINLNSTTPNIFLGNQSTISSSNLSLLLSATSNIGIGTNNPIYYTHIVNTRTRCGLHIDQNANADAFHVNTNGVNRLTVNYSGNVGIGTSAPRAALDVVGSIYNSSGSVTAPSYTFAGNTTSGIYSASTNTINFTCGGVNTATLNQQALNVNNTLQINTTQSFGVPALSITQLNSINANVVEIGNQTNKYLTINRFGSIGINTSVISYQLHVNGNVGINGSVLPINNLQYDLGSDTQRWRDIYLSGSTIDLNGSLISRIQADGSIRVGDRSGNLQKVVASEVQLGDATTNNLVKIQIGPYNNVQFSTVNNATQEVVIFSPLFLNNDALSIGTATALASLHIVGNSNVPVAILNQKTNGDILQLFNNTNQLVTVNQYGNVGIGSAAPQFPLIVTANNLTSTAYFKQTNTNGNVATFSGYNGQNIIISGNGYLGINTSAPIVPLHVKGTQFYDGFANFGSNVYINGNLEVYGDAIAHGNQVVDSDIRLKKDIIRIENALEKIEKISGYNFTMKNNNKRSSGLIAQEVLEVLPEVVTTETEYLGLAYGNMMGLVVEAIKELSGEIKRIKNICKI